MTETVFDNTQTNGAVEENNQETKTESSLVSTDNNNVDVEALQKKASHADAHIAKLEAENAELRAATERSKGVEDVLSHLQSQKQEEGGNTSQLSPADIEKLIATTLNQDKQKTLAETNLKEVDSFLRGQYGEKVGEVLNAKATELGMSIEDLKGMSKSNPAVVKQLFTGEAKAPTNSSMDSVTSVNIGASDNKTADARRAAELKTLFQENKKAYYSPSIQKEVHALAVKGINIL